MLVDIMVATGGYIEETDMNRDRKPETRDRQGRFNWTCFVRVPASHVQAGDSFCWGNR